jgi:hypothetical protein
VERRLTRDQCRDLTGSRRAGTLRATAQNTGELKRRHKRGLKQARGIHTPRKGPRAGKSPSVAARSPRLGSPDAQQERQPRARSHGQDFEAGGLLTSDSWSLGVNGPHQAQPCASPSRINKPAEFHPRANGPPLRSSPCLPTAPHHPASIHSAKNGRGGNRRTQHDERHFGDEWVQQ